VAASVLLGAAPASALPSPPGNVAIIDIVKAGIRFDEEPIVSATLLEVPSGSHTIAMGKMAASTVGVGAGCTLSVVTARPGGVDGEAVTLSESECPVKRAAAGTASVRFVAATSTADAPSGVDLTVCGVVLHADSGTFTDRLDVPACDEPLTVSLNGHAIRRNDTHVIVGHAYLVAFGGSGDVPAHVAVVDQGEQTGDVPPTGTVIETGEPAPVGDRDFALLGPAAAIAFVLIVRRRGVALVVAALLTMSACGTARETPADRDVIVAKPAPKRTRLSFGEPARIEIAGRSSEVISVPADANLLIALRDPTVAHFAGTGAGRGGNLVLAAHSSWNGHPGVFAVLADLVVGDEIAVTDVENHTVVYVVDGAVIKPKTQPWAAAWAPAKPGLVLVTCIGAIGANGLHVDNLWVHAHNSA
jgi:hypothetical protein